METIRGTNLIWLQIPNRQAATLSTASLNPGHVAWQMSYTEATQRLPMLNWPATLYTDETSDT